MKRCLLALVALAALVESSPSCASCCVVTVYPPLPEPTECSPQTITETRVVTETKQVVTTVSEHVTVVVTSTVSPTTGYTSSSYGGEVDTSDASPPTSRTSTSTAAAETVCPAPTNGPCDKPEVPFEPSSNNTFGCAPGFVCDRPKPRGCNLWADSPADDYVCRSSFCIPSPPYSRVHWPEGETGYVPPDKGYFNLNPNAFGLPYSIFEYEVKVTKEYGREHTITTGNWASATELSVFPAPSPSEGQRASPFWGILPDTAREDESDPPTAPAVCFDDCNNCYKEALAVGKSPALCEVGSQFQRDYQLCVSCIDANAENGPWVRQQYVDHKFAQFLRYCEGQETAPTHPISSDASSSATPAPESATGTDTQPHEDATSSDTTVTSVEATSSPGSTLATVPTSRPNEPGPRPTSTSEQKPPSSPDESTAETTSSSRTSIGAGTTSQPDAAAPSQSVKATESAGRDGTTTNSAVGSPQPTPGGTGALSSSVLGVESPSKTTGQSDDVTAWPTAATPSFVIGASSGITPNRWVYMSLLAGVFVWCI